MPNLGKQTFCLGKHEVGLSRMFKTVDGRGHTRKKTGSRTGECWLTLDLDLVAKWLARRALSSKSKKATYLHGAILVKASLITDTLLDPQPQDGQP